MQRFFSKAIQDSTFFRSLFVITITCGILIYLLSSLKGIFPPFIAAFIGAYIFNGPVTKLVKYGFPRGIASALIIVTFLIIVVVGSIIALPYLQNELTLFVRILPSLGEKTVNFLQPFHEKMIVMMGLTDPPSLQEQIGPYMDDILRWSVQFFFNLISNGMVLANTISLTVLTPVIMFYLLKDWPKMINYIDGLLPFKYAPFIRMVATKMDITLGNYAKGQALVCIILMVLYSVGLSIAGLPQAIFTGALSGFFSFIPFAGMLIGFLISISLALVTFSHWMPILGIIAVYIIVPFIEGNFLTPRFVGQKIGLHPVWILFALLAGGNWFGIAGIILALPSAAIIGVLRIGLDYYKTQGKEVLDETKQSTSA